MSVEIDRDACECDGPALVASQVATWKLGNPTGYYCENCGHVFGFEGGYEP